MPLKTINQSFQFIVIYQSHLHYLETYLKEKLILNNFKIELDSSIGNHNEGFLL